MPQTINFEWLFETIISSKLHVYFKNQLFSFWKRRYIQLVIYNSEISNVKSSIAIRIYKGKNNKQLIKEYDLNCSTTRCYFQSGFKDHHFVLHIGDENNGSIFYSFPNMHERNEWKKVIDDYLRMQLIENKTNKKKTRSTY